MASPAPETDINPATSATTAQEPAPTSTPTDATAGALDQPPQTFDHPTPDPAPQPTAEAPAPQESQPSEATAPASPPLPQKHTPVTPGARATRLLEVYDSVLRRTLARVDYDNFAACFPTVATYAPNALRNVQKQMVDYLDDRCNKDFHTILEERDVIRKINELESLVQDAERRRREHASDAPPPVPPHTLPPETILRAHLHPHLAQQHSHLGAALANTKLENEKLFEDIKAQREEVQTLLAALESVVADVDGANALLAEVAPELAAEARRADVEMTGM